MAFRYRKSFKVMPGVRMTVSPRGISTSVGVPGARITRTATGRVTRTIGIPGTGISSTTTISSPAGREPKSIPARPPQAAPTAPTPAPKPGFLAPSWEKTLHGILISGKPGSLADVARDHSEAAPVAVAVDAFTSLANNELARSVELLRWEWSHAGDLENHPFVRKYLQGPQVTVHIADGVSATLPLGRDAVGLALAEVEQALGNVDTAIAVVEQLEPSHVAAVSLSELYVAARRYADVLDVTNGIENVDDPTALLLTYRGIAFRETGMHTASLEGFKSALKSSKRDPRIRHLALIERAGAQIAAGRNANARRDLERVLAEDSSYPGVRGLLATLTSSRSV